MIVCRDWEQRRNSWSGVWLFWCVSWVCNKVVSKFHRVVDWWKGGEESGEKGRGGIPWETHVFVCFNLGCKLHLWRNLDWTVYGVWCTLSLSLQGHLCACWDCGGVFLWFLILVLLFLDWQSVFAFVRASACQLWPNAGKWSFFMTWPSFFCVFYVFEYLSHIFDSFLNWSF